MGLKLWVYSSKRRVHNGREGWQQAAGTAAGPGSGKIPFLCTGRKQKSRGKLREASGTKLEIRKAGLQWWPSFSKDPLPKASRTFPKQCLQLGTEYSNIWTYGRHPSFQLPQTSNTNLHYADDLWQLYSHILDLFVSNDSLHHLKTHFQEPRKDPVVSIWVNVKSEFPNWLIRWPWTSHSVLLMWTSV